MSARGASLSLHGSLCTRTVPFEPQTGWESFWAFAKRSQFAVKLGEATWGVARVGSRE